MSSFLSVKRPFGGPQQRVRFPLVCDEFADGREMRTESGRFRWLGSRPPEWCNSVCLGMMAQGAERLAGCGDAAGSKLNI